MQIENDAYGAEPVRGDLRLLLLLVAFSCLGLLIWAGLFLAIQWLLLTVWTAASAP